MLSVDEITAHFTKRPVWAQIDLHGLAHNMETLRQRVGKDVKICSVVKGNGYGHGAATIAGVLLRHGADSLAVACLDEGVELRKAGITAPILVLGHTDGRRAREAIAQHIDVTVFHYRDAKAFSAIAVAVDGTARLHIAVDTGMGRIGYRPTVESIEAIGRIAALPHVVLAGCFTHFCVSDADDVEDQAFTQQQFERFMWFRQQLEHRNIHIGAYHCCNSAGILSLPDYYCDAVRTGIVQYGYDPSAAVNVHGCGLKEAMSLHCCISHLKVIEAGETVSYGRHFMAKEQDVIATIPIGYADGYPRILSNRMDVLIHGRRAPLVGNICMDQCMVDVTAIPDVHIGDEVVLFGRQGNAAIEPKELADKAGTIVYEILCNINRRVPRVYTDGDNVVKRVEYLFDDH